MINLGNIVLLSINAVVPIFALILIGYVLKKMNLYQDVHLNAMNRLVFYLLLPVLLFYNIYTADLEHTFDWHLVLFGLAAITTIFAVSILTISRMVKENGKQGAIIQGIVRSNYILMALPLAEALAGSGGAATASMLGAVLIPYMNVLSVIILEKKRGRKISVLKLIQKIFTNPLVLAAILGILMKLLWIPLPTAVLTTLKNIKQSASPLALIVLGGGLHFSSAKENIKPLLIAIIAKLVIVPAVGLSVAVALGFRDRALVALLCLFATPPATSTYTLAQQMDSDSEIAGQFLTLATALSILSIFIIVYIVLLLGLI